jgi:hypothetical protein
MFKSILCQLADNVLVFLERLFLSLSISNILDAFVCSSSSFWKSESYKWSAFPDVYDEVDAAPGQHLARIQFPDKYRTKNSRRRIMQKKKKMERGTRERRK